MDKSHILSHAPLTGVILPPTGENWFLKVKKKSFFMYIKGTV